MTRNDTTRRTRWVLVKAREVAQRGGTLAELSALTLIPRAALRTYLRRHGAGLDADTLTANSVAPAASVLRVGGPGADSGIREVRS